jgi:hypothetical protein
MAIDFPNSPANNDTYTFGDKTWIYADGKWTIAFTSTMTLTSLNVTGDITVDTTTLKVDSSTDRVGIGTASPLSKLHIADSSGYGVRVSATTNLGLIGSNGESDGLRISGGIPDQVTVGGNIYLYGNTHATRAADVALLSNGSEILTVDGATLRVGIGVLSPTTALDVSGTVTATTFAGSGASLTALPAANLTGATLASGVTGSSLTSVGNLTNLTVTNAINGTLTKTVTGTNTADLIYGNMADNDQFRIRIGGTATNAGFVEIATADDGTEPIHVRQYTGVFSSLTRTATLLDDSGNTSFPGTLTLGSGGTLRTIVAVGGTTKYGSLQISGDPQASGWEGYSIAGNAVFMSQATYFGLYDNTNLEWGLLCTRNGTTELFHNGSSKIQTTSTGATTTGTHTATTFSGALSGNATSATTATTATTATNQSGGYVSATSVTSSGTIYSTREVTTDYTTTNIRAGSGGSAVSIALHASGVAPQFRVGASADVVYLRNYEDSAYSNFYAIIVNTSSRSLKQDISNWPVKPQSAGSAVNGLELINSLDIVKQLRPVTYKWIHDDYMAQLPTTETRVKALERLNSARQNAGIDPWFGEDLIHKCGRDCQGSIESPCPRYLDWDKGQIGFIAEEVAEVVPQAGRIDAEGNFSGLDGLSMSAIAIAAIKELEVRVAALENR